jgi:hypothetical protein
MEYLLKDLRPETVTANRRFWDKTIARESAFRDKFFPESLA